MSNFPPYNPWQGNPYMAQYLAQQGAQMPSAAQFGANPSLGAYQAQTAPQNAIRGRMVPSAEDIAPAEVPTDGSVGYFPLSDGSAVIAKTWANDGRIITARYSLEEEQPEPEAEEKPDAVSVRLDDVMDMLLEISGKVDALEAKPKPAARARKAAQDD